MLYDVDLKDTIVDTLNTKVSTIVESIVILTEEGYVPNNRKIIQLDWCSLLINAFENIDLFSEEQKKNIERLFNTIIK